MKIVEISELVKKYGENIAVDNLSLHIMEGEIYGLLGPNGAGKSTLINVLTALLKPTSGTVKIMGVDTKDRNLEIRRNIGVVPQNIAVYMEFTAYENVRLFGELYGLKGKELKKSVKGALEFVGLLDSANKKVKTFSGGMVRRLNIACGIVHKPKLLIMDEPTVGIDPQSRNHILNAIKILNEKGMTVIYTSHYMEEVEAICSRIAIIDKGKILVEGTNKQLKDMISDKKVLKVSVDDGCKVNTTELEDIRGVYKVIAEENDFTINTDKEINNLDIVIKGITSSGAKILDLGFKEVTLETVFLALTGRRFRD